MGFLNDESNDLDNILDVVLDKHRRDILYYLNESGDAWYDELVNYLNDEYDEDVDTLDMRLRHVHLPKLEETGVAYQSDIGRVRYEGDEKLDRVLEVLEEIEDNSI